MRDEKGSRIRRGGARAWRWQTSEREMECKLQSRKAYEWSTEEIGRPQEQGGGGERAALEREHRRKLDRAA